MDSSSPNIRQKYLYYTPRRKNYWEINVKPQEHDNLKDFMPNTRIAIAQKVLNIVLKDSGFKYLVLIQGGQILPTIDAVAPKFSMYLRPC